MAPPKDDGSYVVSARRSLAEDVYDAVSELLTSRAIKPGGRATIDHIARTLGVSRTPVREALARLESDGLLIRRPHSGYTVVAHEHSRPELFEMRLLIDPYASRTAADRTDTRTLAELERLCDYLAQTDQLQERAELDASFHLLIATCAGNRLLVRSLARINALEREDRRLPKGDVRSMSREYRELLDAIKNGDPESAELAMVNHLMRSHRPALLRPTPNQR